MKVHLVDGTYELYRQHFGAASYRGEAREFDATVGVLSSTLQLIEQGATHLGVATDHQIESFRNELYAGYKTGEGMPTELMDQLPILESALIAMGVTVWAMIDYEADDAIAAAAAVAADDARVEQVLIVSPDKDLAQCVVDERVVYFDRKTHSTLGARGVIDKFGVPPASIPDYLALVGDAADGFPGLAGWGAKSASSVLARYGHLEHIPAEVEDWDVAGLRGAARLNTTLRENFDEALLFRILATLETSVDVGRVDDWHWNGATSEFAAVAERLGAPRLAERAEALRRLR